MSAADSKRELELSPKLRNKELDDTTPPDNEPPPRLSESLRALSSASSPGLSGPVIAVDLDDVLSQTNLEVANWHNEHYGTDMDLSKFYYYYYWKNPYWGGLEETFEKVRDFYATRRIFEAKPVPGAREGIQALHDMGFKLIIVTARSPENHEDSWKWVEKWFPGLFHSVVCTGQFKDAGKAGHEVTTKLSKAEVCANLQARLLIDDSSENALQVAAPTPPIPPTPVLLFGDYEWNSRVSSAKDAVDTMVFDTRLQIEGGREFWKEEKLEDHIPEGAPIQRVKDWAAAVRWVKKAREEGKL
ncbi:hypothetical protein VNI00_008967 [Paramarasmius palmivorus]|uniref:Uncharacterized protein n=1 Tax=Paramarasmius palmivorus TaxID=297713 RepID=A0AAW0CS09_9AGAR